MLALAAAEEEEGAAKPPPPELTAPRRRSRGGRAEDGRLLAGSTKVMLFRVSGQPGVRPNPTLAVGVDFERQGQGRELTEGETRRFKELVFDDKSFKLDKPPPCGDFKPNSRFWGPATPTPARSRCSSRSSAAG